MAKVFPSLEQIKYLRQSPTEGELHLLEFLLKNLDDNYEIYFQPFLNGDRPDIILMRPDAGVMIIEVKDWNLKNYNINQQKQWLVTQDGKNWSKIKSPIDQVSTYKQNLYDLHIENLLEQNIKNSNSFSLVTCAVYFHGETYQNIDKFLKGKFKDDEKYLKKLSYIAFFGQDSLTKMFLNQVLNKNHLNRKSKFFDDSLYKSFKRHLQPPYHSKEEGKSLEYKDKQQKLIISEPKHQKIKGVAGAGKTCVLAKRAVNALKRISSESSLEYNYHPKILILTFNITLKNYIHDKISQVREDFYWSNFYIKNYHDFITQELNNLEIPIEIPDGFDDWTNEQRNEYFEENYYSNKNLFHSKKRKINTYSVILIDEIQDYKKEWVQIIREFFLDKNGEFVAFGDEKQNVYGRTMDDEKKPYTGIGGNWNKLSETFRLSLPLSNLANNFQNYFFQEKYELEPINIDNIENNEQNIIRYIPLSHKSAENIYKMIDDIAIEYMIHPNDICIQSSKIELLREINFYATQTTKIKTTLTFETLEIYYLTILEIVENFVLKTEPSQENSFFANQINQYKLKIQKLKQLFERNTENNKLNQSMIKALSYSFYRKNPIVEEELQHYISEKNITMIDYEQWAKQMVEILQRLSQNKLIINRINNQLDKIRKNKKWNFWMNSGNIKFSTIHSFKGWEVDSLFLILDKEIDHNFTTDELIYTAITRCRRNLFIFDFDQSRYFNFFN